MSGRSIFNHEPTKRFRASCESIVRKIHRQAFVIRWGCSQNRLLGNDFWILVPFGTLVDVSAFKNIPRILVDSSTISRAIKEQIGDLNFCNVDTGGAPIYDVDWDEHSLITPGSKKRNKRGQRRVLLDNPVPFTEFIKLSKRVMSRRKLSPEHTCLLAFYSGPHNNLEFDGMISKWL